MTAIPLPPPEAAAAHPVPWLVYASGGKFQAPRHVRWLGDQVMRLVRGDTLRLVVSMPPRHGKSVFLAQHFTSWWLGTHPADRVIYVTMQERFSRSWGRKARDLFFQFAEQLWGVTTWSRSSTAEWEVFRDGKRTDGSMSSVGAGGTITGKGAHVLVIDDLIRNMAEASNKTLRETQWEWFQSACLTRLEPPGRVIILMCLTGDSRVAMGDGTWRAIKDVRPGEKVWSLDSARSLVRARVLDQRLSGEQRVLRVTTDRMALKASGKHPFLVLKSDRTRGSGETEWRLAKDLRIGDVVVTLRSLPDKGARVDSEWVWFLGFMFGDGWVTKWKRRNKNPKTGKVYNTHAWCVCAATSIYPELNARVVAAFERFFGRRPFLTKFGYIRLDCAEAGRKLAEMGLRPGVRANAKTVPEWVHRLAPEGKRSFLRGLMDADGCREKRMKEAYRFVSASRELVEGVRLLALASGVRPSSIYTSTNVAKPPHSPRSFVATSYSLSLSFQEARGGGSSFAKKWPHNKTLRLERVRSIEALPPEPTYDLAVEGSENFIAEGFVVHNTRWNHDDLIGRLMKAQKEGELGEQWEFLNLPAIAEEDDPLGRKPGEALWPERFPISYLEKKRKDVGPFVWQSLYQGRPTPRSGNVFKASWFKKYETVAGKAQVPDFGTIDLGTLFKFATVDLAASKKKRADWTVMAVWGFCAKWNVVLLLALERQRYEGHELVPALKRLHMEHGPSRVYVEREGPLLKERIGSVLKEALREGVPILELSPDGDKVARALAVTGPLAAGQVFFPAKAPWLGDLEEELLTFPDGKHDDQVDAVTYGIGVFQELVRTPRGGGHTPRKNDDGEEKPRWQIGR